MKINELVHSLLEVIEEYNRDLDVKIENRATRTNKDPVFKLGYKQRGEDINLMLRKLKEKYNGTKR